MPEPTPPPPVAYKFCELHMQPSIGPNRCKVCFTGQPTTPTAAAQEVVKSSPVAETPPPAVSDPTAQKTIEDAQDYADAVRAVVIITSQVKDAKECLLALEKKLRESKEIAATKLKITQEATK